MRFRSGLPLRHLAAWRTLLLAAAARSTSTSTCRNNGASCGRGESACLTCVFASQLGSNGSLISHLTVSQCVASIARLGATNLCLAELWPTSHGGYNACRALSSEGVAVQDIMSMLTAEAGTEVSAKAGAALCGRAKGRLCANAWVGTVSPQSALGACCDPSSNSDNLASFDR